MKNLPTVVASPLNDASVALDAFDSIVRVVNRDAVDVLFVARTSSTSRQRLLGVRFSGTVMAVRLESFGLPNIGDRAAAFRTFAETAIGDELDESGALNLELPDERIHIIDCFSPHFQAWRDRPPASDEQVEAYLFAHALASWHFAQPSWVLGPSDLLRLNRTLPDVLRLVQLHEGVAWSVSNRTSTGASLTPIPAFIRDRRAARTQPTHKDGPLAPSPNEPAAFVFVDESRIADLRRLETDRFDLAKLIGLCEELNICYRSQCYLAVAALTRSLLDHVPPIFNCPHFAAVASTGSRSFKETMAALESMARKVADQHLHGQIRQSETLPTRVQVDFSQAVDVLLGEIVRLLQTPGNKTST